MNTITSGVALSELDASDNYIMFYKINNLLTISHFSGQYPIVNRLRTCARFSASSMTATA